MTAQRLICSFPAGIFYILVVYLCKYSVIRFVNTRFEQRRVIFKFNESISPEEKMRERERERERMGDWLIEVKH